MLFSRSRVDAHESHGRLARQLVTAILVGGTLVVLLATALQMVREYSREMERIDEHFDHIDRAILDSVARNVWLVDTERLQLQVDGITSFQDFTYAGVADSDGELLVYSGSRGEGALLERAWNLDFKFRGANRPIGVLSVSMQLSSLYGRLLQRTWVVLLIYALVVGVIALLLYVLVYRLIARHLEKLAEYARGYDREKNHGEFALDRIPGGSRDELDDLVAAFNFMIRNLSGTVKALQAEVLERKEAEEARRVSEARFEQLASAVDQVFWLMDWKSGEMIYVSPAYERIWGASVERIYRDPKHWVDAIVDEDRQRVEHDFGKADRGRFELEYRIQRSDGSVRNIYDRGFPLHDEQHQVYRVAGVAEDITERKHLEDALRKVNEDLEKRVQVRTAALAAAKELAESSSRAKSAFLDNMSHELRTPLNVILGFSQLLERDPAVTDSMRESLVRIRESGTSLLRLFNDILEMASIESGRIEVVSEAFSPRSALDQQMDMISAKLDAKGLGLEVEVGLEVPAFVLGDGEKFSRIVGNMLSNAVKFTEAGGVRLSLSWAGPIEEKPANLICEVVDSGIGISGSDLGRIFNFFTQAGEDGLNLGAGLGLSITRHYVDLLGGHIDVESELGVGSRFTVSVPVGPVQSPGPTYGEVGQEDPAAMEGGGAGELTADELNALPREVRGELLGAAVALDNQLLLDYVRDFELEHPQLASKIRSHIENMTLSALVRSLRESIG